MKTLTILFILTSHAMMGDTGQPTGVWLEELTTPYYALKDAGYDVKLASIKGGEIPIDPRSLEGEEELPESVKRFLADEDAMNALKNSAAIENVNATQYAAVFLPGGHGTMFDLPESERLAEIVSETLTENRIVAAVCHGPAGLVSAKNANGEPVVKGKNVAAFTNSEEEAVELTDAVPFLLETGLKELGANVITAPDFQPHAVQDGHLITGQNPSSSGKVAELIINTLNEQSLSE